MTLHAMNGRLTFLIVGGTAVFMVVVAVALFWLLGKAEEKARHASGRFVTALERNDPRAAPEGGADYVAGIRHYFGPVKRAEVIDAHNKSINTGDNADTRSYFVADVLLRAQRGPAVVELEFDDDALTGGESVSGIRELEPGDVPGGALAPELREQLERAFATRGGKPADQLTLSGALADMPQPGTPTSAPDPEETQRLAPDASSQSGRDDAIAQLQCVQKANGDVTKLQKCAD
jgi:hypothetical protein